MTFSSLPFLVKLQLSIVVMAFGHFIPMEAKKVSIFKLEIYQTNDIFIT